MMKMNQASGFVTLTVTLMLTLAGSYLFFQSVDSAYYTVMRYQNTLSAKKNHWAAEGGLACAYGVNKTTPGTPMSRDYSLCRERVLGGSQDEDRLRLNVTPTEVISGSLYTLRSEAAEKDPDRGKRVVMRDIQLTGGSPMPGVFKTSSKLQLTGSFDILPNKNTNKDNENECISIVLKDQKDFIYSDYTENSQLVVKDSDGYHLDQLPTGFDPSGLVELNERAVDGNFKCKEGYQSYLQVGSKNLGNDILADPNMDMFQDLFGVPKEQWKSVRDSEFEVIKASAGETRIEDCAQQIAATFASGKKKIWIEGSCLIKNPNTGVSQIPFKFSDVQTPMEGQAFVVVQDGVVFAPQNFGFSGLLYQFKTGLRQDVDILGDMEKLCNLGALCGNNAFFVYGSMYLFGGIAVDMEGMGFDVFASMRAYYDSSKWRDLLLDVRWKEGTWRDF